MADSAADSGSQHAANTQQIPPGDDPPTDKETEFLGTAKHKHGLGAIPPAVYNDPEHDVDWDIHRRND